MVKVITENRKASHDYFIEQKIEAGIKLTGTEIKSIRANKCNINDSYAIIKNGKIYILNMHISKYDYGTYYNHDETRTRELLMHQNEITKLFNRARLDGETLIPLRVYLKEGLCKIEIGVCKGKNKGDKREALKAEDARREARKALKDRNHF
ncbi:MAG: SsrA-binding protein SmpB [Acholeplasmatales bacterium]|nr:SsrA-binding protein SmpB [Acholeplasmatales bacterium]